MVLSNQQKLQVLYRLEPGCLGSDGVKHIEGFCQFATEQMKPIDAEMVVWTLTPRYDKSLLELEYKVGERSLTTAQVEKYLHLFERNLSGFEAHLEEVLSLMVDQYFGR